MADTAAQWEFEIRPGVPADGPAIRQLIQQLADAQNTPNGPEIGADQLSEDLRNERVHAFVARLTGAQPTDAPVGMALYYYAYSTWQGQYIHLEDLIVSAPYRRRGLAQRLIKEVIKVALSKKMKRVQWTVLEKNHTARALYKKIGSADLTEAWGWHITRMDEHKMRQMLQSDGESPGPNQEPDVRMNKITENSNI